ncbi:DUF2712 domain-containing protein [Bacillus vallismortis]|uniref:DUF2712 domain-containing protein n=1 Tax=Bacillus vallismortis TaxID=72361 RepID=UPI00374D6CA3
MKIGIKATKYIKVGLVLLIASFWSTSANKVFASNDNHDYYFEIQPFHYNNYSGERYRQTTSTGNEWKVRLDSSGEGKGTITTFWLGDKDSDALYGYAQGSITKNVYQGAKATYTKAYSRSNQSWVALGAENNNYSSNTYWASGVWDEEIW